MSLTLQTLALYSLLAGTPKTTATHDTRAEAAKPKKDAGTGLTPMDQSDSEGDLKLTQAIRRAVMDDNRLSFTAKNVKIISRDGSVTLRGQVNSPAERDIVCALAAKAAGAGKVDDQLELPTGKPANSN